MPSMQGFILLHAVKRQAGPSCELQKVKIIFTNWGMCHLNRRNWGMQLGHALVPKPCIFHFFRFSCILALTLLRARDRVIYVA